MPSKRKAKPSVPRRKAAKRLVRSGNKRDRLADYRAKRDFQKTAEPKGRTAKTAGHRFVIQKHDASRLHYDFRLEVGGTLKSWAVPKGIPFAKGEKHLAVQVEDHPLEYGGFEGVIPKGQYGGGTVMLWDAGTYENLGSDAAKDLAAGKLHFALAGKKLRGEWTLVRIKRGDGKEWLLIKSGEDMKSLAKRRDDESSSSGRRMAEIARAQDAQWNSRPASTRRKIGKPRAALKFIPPMKATLLSEPPSHGHWLYELKFDGYRALALKRGSQVQLLSRNEKDFSARFPEIAEAVAALDADDVALDGEIVALKPNGIPSFQLLQALEIGTRRPPLAFYLFDLLRLDGQDLTRLPLHERRAQLQQLLSSAEDPLRFSGTIEGQPAKLLAEVGRRGLEGLIGKERDSLYEAGQRSRSWIKLKCIAEQEFVIGGYTPPEGTRKNFGALLVGVYEKKALRFAGKVGTGFTGAMLRTLHRRMRALERKDCPFANLPERTQGRWQQNITPREMSRCRWVEPRLVCQVRFTEWTNDGKLRHPAFLGLREDKDAADVTREKPA
jgi:bifunctional non-homologous end joining protein LigD